MPEKFHERFDIEVNLDEAKRRFVNRTETLIFTRFLSQKFSMEITEDIQRREDIKREVVAGLGEVYHSQESLRPYVLDDFYKALQALEALYQAVVTFWNIYPDISHERISQLKELIERLLRESEVDLGIRWENGHFVKSGAELLDEKLVNDALKWLKVKGYENVLAPYRKGLHHFLQAEKRPEVLADVVTDMYESLEALAKIVTKRLNQDLSSNRELFIKELQASNAYKMILKKYIEYANIFRHAPKPDQPRPSLFVNEVESFIYLTGAFIG
jgi:hypothetical protein